MNRRNFLALSAATALALPAGAAVPQYAVPPDATQVTFSEKIDTSDARHTQAVQAINPARAGTVHSFYTQHTVANSLGTGSVVRWYEINPATALPLVLRTGMIEFGNTDFAFNGAISPDRKKHGATVAFGDSFVIQHNASEISIAPRIQAWSSFRGGPVSGNGAMVVQPHTGPYKNFTCPNTGNVCPWGGYAAATPDPPASQCRRHQRRLGHQPVLRGGRPDRLADADLRDQALIQNPVG